MSASVVRGSRVGSGPLGEDDRGEAAPRKAVSYFCGREHETVLSFAVEAEAPRSWDCPRCGTPASRNHDSPPASSRAEPYKSHLAYVKERRSDEEAAQILSEALTSLRSRRKSGEVLY